MRQTALRIGILAFAAAVPIVASVPAEAPAGARLVVTGTVREGETASGSVVGRDGSLLIGVVVEVAGKPRTTDSEGRFTIPVAVTAGNRVAVLLRTAGGNAERVSVPVLDRLPAGAPIVKAAPALVISREVLRVSGAGFAPNAAANTVQLGESIAPVLASSAGELAVLPNAAEPGSTRLTIKTEKGESAPKEIEVLRVRLLDADRALLRGKKGDARLAIEGTRERVKLEVVNETPQTIRLEGGERQTVTTSGGATNFAKLNYRGESAGDFGLTVKLAANEKALPVGDVRAGRDPAGPVPVGPVPVKTKKCVKFPCSVEIKDWDVVGALYRNRALRREPSLSFDVNDVRFELRVRVSASETAVKRIESLFAQFGATAKLADCKPPQMAQSFPAMPELTFAVNLCASPEAKDLASYLGSPAQAKALDAWFEAYRKSVGEFGLPAGKVRTQSEESARIMSKAMKQIEDASIEFQDEMETAMALRYNAREAEAKLGKAIAAIATGDIAGLLISHALESAGMDPKLADLTSGLIGLASGDLGGTLASGVAGAGVGAMSGPGQKNIGDKVAAAAARNAEYTRNLAFAMAVLNDDVWKQVMASLVQDGFRKDALDRFDEIRHGLRIEVDRALADLCKEHAKIQALIPAMKKAQEEAERRVHSSYFKQAFQTQVGDLELGCKCCQYSDGSGPDGVCAAELRAR